MALAHYLADGIARADLTPNASTRLDFDRPSRFHFGAPDV
jgi:hypothetical protein